MAAWRARHVGFVFQFYNLLAALNAERNVELPLLLTHLSKSERRQHVETALKVVGLSHRTRHFPRQLSGGEQQRVGIARAIVTDPTLLLCDEPTGDLDRKSGDEILSLLQALNRDHGKTIIMVTHDPHASARASHTVYLDKGQLTTAAAGMKFLGLIWSNLKRRKLRTALTVLSILIAFLLFGFLCAIKEAFTAGVTLAGQDRLVVRHKVSIIQSLPESYKRRIQNIPGVEAVAQQSWFGGIYQDPKNFFASIVVRPEEYLDMFPEFIVPAEQKDAWLKARTGVIVGDGTMKRFGWKIGDHIPLTCPIWGEPEGKSQWDFEIVGTYTGAKKGTDTTQFLIRYDYFDEARPRGKGEVGWFAVRIKDPDQAAVIAQQIDDEFANSPYETKAEPEGAFAAGFAQQVGDIGTIMIAVLSAVFFTILLVVGNTMGQAVRERTEEIGVLKAIGFTNDRVLFLVLLESCIVAMAGGLGGLLLAWGIISAGNPVPQLLPIFYLPGRYIAIGAGIVLALGLVAGIFPALQAMHLRIAEALRRNA